MNLPSWNDTPTKKAVQDFVAAVTDENGPEYVPPAERLAVFDNDGTLWCEKPMYIQLDYLLREIMPLLFILFFCLAGAHLRLSELPKLGLVGLVYVLARSFGLIGGSRLGALVGGMEDRIKKWIGLGILSQAGVAIGLSLIVKQEFTPLSAWGASIGTTVITTITEKGLEARPAYEKGMYEDVPDEEMGRSNSA